MSRDRPKILYVFTIPMSLSFVRGNAAFMRERGFSTVAVTSGRERQGEELAKFGREEEIDVFPIEMARKITPAGDLRSIVALVRLIRRLRPVIVQAGTPKAGLLAMIAAWAVRVPVRLYMMQGLPHVTAVGWQRRLLMTTERISCRLAHRVLAVGPSCRQVAIEEKLVPADKIVVLGGGSTHGVASADRFNPASPDRLAGGVRIRSELGIPLDAPVLGFVGRLVRDKGIVDLAVAWETLRESHPELRLLLVGPFEPRDPVPPDVRARLEADPRVTITGYLLETADHYAAMDVFAFPSYREGLPNAPLEAAAMELPVVAARIPGTVDVVDDGVTGTLVELGRAAELAAAVSRYLDDPDLRRRHGEAGRARMIREFRGEVIKDLLHRQYVELLAAAGRPAPAIRPASASPSR